MTVRMKDIAEQLGVSISTVSLALAGHPRIPEATRTQVVLLAHKLGYKLPHERRNTALCLAIILTDPASPMGCLYHEAISGIINEAMASGAILQIMQPPPPRAGGRSQLLNLLRKNGAHGAILIGGRFASAIVKAFIEQDYPFICVGKRELPPAKISWVATDYVEGARQAVSHLIRLGHRRIALLSPPHYEQAWFKERILGYRLAMDEAGLAHGPSLTWQEGYVAPSIIPSVLLEKGATAVFAIDQILAAKLLSSCAAAQIKVPQELAVVGFDDITGSAHLSPPLTTVRQPMQELGSTAARTLLSWLRGAQRNPVQIRLQPELVVRMSCGTEAAKAAEATGAAGAAGTAGATGAGTAGAEGTEAMA